MAGNNQYGKIQLSVRVDKKGVSSSLKAVEKDVASLASKGKQLANLGAQLRGLGEGVNRFGRRVAVAGAALQSGLVLATKQTGDFERALSSIKVNIGSRILKDLDIAPQLAKTTQSVGSAVRSVNKEYKQLEATFKSIARQFPKGPLEIAGAGNRLARAGLTKNIIQGLNPAEAKKQGREAGSGGILRPLVQLSVADTTGASLDEITEKGINLLKAFDKLNNAKIRTAIESGNFTEAEKLSQEMAKGVTRDFATILKASTQANVSVVSLAESMKFAGGVLADVVKGDDTGKSFREVIAVTSILQERLGDASIAGTALRGMLLRLKNPPKEVSERMKALGFDLKEIRKGSKSGSAGLLDMLKAVEKMKQNLKGGKATQSEFNDFIASIFENRQVTAALSLIDTSTKELERRVENLRIEGDPEEFFNQFEKILNNNVQGALGKTISAIQNMGLALGSALSDPAQGALDSIGKLADEISNFVENNQDLIRGLALATAGMVAIGGVITATGAAFSTLAITVIAAGLAMEVFANKGLLLGGLTRSVGALGKAYKGLAAAQAATLVTSPAATLGTVAKNSASASKGLNATAAAATSTAAASKALVAPTGGRKANPFASMPLVMGQNRIIGPARPPVAPPAPAAPPVVGAGKAKAVQQGLFAASGAASFAPKMPIIGPVKQQMLDFTRFAKDRSGVPRRGGVRGASATTAALAGITLSKADNKLFSNAAKNFGKGNKNWPKVTKRLEKLGVKGARGKSFKELKDILKNLTANTGKGGTITPVMSGVRGSKPIGAFGGDMRRRAESARVFGRSTARSIGRGTAESAFFDKGRVREFRKRRSFLQKSMLRMRDFAAGGASRTGGFLPLAGRGGGPLGLIGKRTGGAAAAAGAAIGGRVTAATATAGVAFRAMGDVGKQAVMGIATAIAGLAKSIAVLTVSISTIGVALVAALAVSGETFRNFVSDLSGTISSVKTTFTTLGKVFASLKFDNLLPDEDVADRVQIIGDTLRAGFKAIGTSVGLEFAVAMFNVVKSLVKSIFMAFVGIGETIANAIGEVLSGKKVDGNSLGFLEALSNEINKIRDDALDDLKDIADAADKRIAAGKERQALLEAKFLGITPGGGFSDSGEVDDLRKEFVQKLVKGEFGDSDSEEAIEKAGISFRQAVEELEKKDLISFADGLREKLETAGDKLKTKLDSIALADERGVLKPGEREKFEADARAEFKAESPIFKAAEEHMKAAEKLKEAGKSLTAKIDPRVSLDQRVKELSDLFASGAISLGTFRQAVEDAEFEESERLTALQKERAARGRGGAGASQVGSGTFFSKFNQLLGRGGQDETTIRKKVLTAQVDFLEIAKTALKAAGENLKNSDIGTAAQTAFENIKSEFDQPLANLVQAGDNLKEAASSLMKSYSDSQSKPEPDPVVEDTKEAVSAEAPSQQRPVGISDPSQPRAAGMQQIIQNQSKSFGILENFFGGLFFVSESDMENLKSKKTYRPSGGAGYPTGMGSGRFGGFRANGGGVNRGKGYVVGERGPELFFPTESGQILSNGLSKKVDGMFATGTDGQDEILKRLEQGISARDHVRKQVADEYKANPKSASAQLMQLGSGIADLLEGPFRALNNTFSLQGPNDAAQEAFNIKKMSNDIMNRGGKISAGGAGDVESAKSRAKNAQEQFRKLNEQYGVDSLGGYGKFDMTGLPDMVLDTVSKVGLGGLSSAAQDERRRREGNGLSIPSKGREDLDFVTDLVSGEASRKNKPAFNLLRDELGVDPSNYMPQGNLTGNTSTEGFEAGLDNIKALDEEFGDLRMTIDDVSKDLDGIPIGDFFPPRSAEQITMDNLTKDFFPPLLQRASSSGVPDSLLSGFDREITSVDEIGKEITGRKEAAANVDPLGGLTGDVEFGASADMKKKADAEAKRQRLARNRAIYEEEKLTSTDPRSLRRRSAQMQRSAMAAGGNYIVPDAAMNAMPNAAVDAGRVGAGAGNLQKADLEPLAKDATINELIGKVGELIGKVSTGGLME